MLDEFFTFPIVMIDGENEERKQQNKTRFGDLPSGEEEDEVKNLAAAFVNSQNFACEILDSATGVLAVLVQELLLF